MDVMQFTQALSRIWVLETRLLDKAKVERMLEANSADEVLKILGETEYANIMGNVKRATDYEEILSTELKRVYKLVYELCPVKEIVDLMSIKYKYHNIKVLLKGKFLNKDFSNMLIDLGKEDFLNFVKNAISSMNLSGKQTLILNEEGLKFVAEAFIDELNKNVDAQIILGETAGNFKGGFILENNGIEINSTYEALVSSLRDELEFEVAKVLFN